MTARSASIDAPPFRDRGDATDRPTRLRSTGALRQMESWRAASSIERDVAALQLGVALEPFGRPPLFRRDGLVRCALHALAAFDEGGDHQLVDLRQPRRMQQRIYGVLDGNRARALRQRQRLALPARPRHRGVERRTSQDGAPALAVAGLDLRAARRSAAGRPAIRPARCRACRTTTQADCRRRHAPTSRRGRAARRASHRSRCVHRARARASSTVTLKPESCSSRAATSPAMPAPTTTTCSALPAPIDHEPVAVIRAPARATASCR